jgi:DNA-binding beta-propeller fold protein YncE
VRTAAGSSSRRLVVFGGAALAAILAFFAWSAVRADAAEQLYWDNWNAEPASVSFADGQGLGGGPVNLGGYQLDSPEGMAYDSATNRLFVPSTHYSGLGEPGEEGEGHIAAIDLGGGGATNFTAPGALIRNPRGIAVDPTTRTLYWINEIDSEYRSSISWAKLDGSAGGTLNTAGATLQAASRLTIDPAIGRLYWANAFPTKTIGEELEPIAISWASVTGSGGGNLNISGSTPTYYTTGIAVDHAGSRVYWLNPAISSVSYAALNGGSSGDIQVSSEAVQNSPYGLAFEPAQGKFLWGNYGDMSEHGPQASFGFLTLAGATGTLTPNLAPVDGAQDPLIIKSPAATAPPLLTRVPKAPNKLSCSTGAWAADLPGDSLYQAPRTYAYQWSKNGVAIAGATAAILATTAKGSYACTVTAANQAGAGAATASAAASVRSAKLKLSSKKKLAKAKPGKLATFNVSAANKGDLATGKSAKLCVKLSKSLKKSFKAKCIKVGGVKGLGSKVAKIKVKVKPMATAKTYSLKVVASGVSSKPLKIKLKVLG